MRLQACLNGARPAVDVPIGVSTGAWVIPDPDARIDAIARRPVW
jgi:hypothetical protein